MKLEKQDHVTNSLQNRLIYLSVQYIHMEETQTILSSPSPNTSPKPKGLTEKGPDSKFFLIKVTNNNLYIAYY